jgi:acyl-CoA dehydrogenase
MQLFHPHQLGWLDGDPKLQEMVRRTVDFFESMGKTTLKQHDHERHWYQEFIDFQAREGIFATLLTPQGDGDGGTRWDTWRISVYSEVLAFYGLCYWYTWQVSILGLGPIWMSANAGVREQTARYLREGGVFAFGLSEKEHGADIYSSDMILSPRPDGTYVANGQKYYIGNGETAALVSTFGKQADSGDYVFFAVGTQHEQYAYLKNTVNSQSTVAEYVLDDYPIQEEDILHKGQEAWNAALNTINVGKYNLGWASIGICEHALYEAITHAANRKLYGMSVTDFPHVKRLFVDAWSRLTAMRLFARRAADYMRSATADDRRYLLYNPIVKMKVTMQGERVIDDLWDVIAAKGFERDTYFEMAARDIRALPKLEGTAHVNMALVLKFMTAYFMNVTERPEVPRRDDAVNDDFLMNQGAARGLSRTQFHDHNLAYGAWDTPNLAVFKEQILAFQMFGMSAPPSPEQQKDIDWLLEVGGLFTLIAYGQLILESAKLDGLHEDVIDSIFDVFIREFSRHATELSMKPSTREDQQALALAMIKRPVVDAERFDRVWKDRVLTLDGVYEMKP